jgi:hypothetical protein
MVDEEEAGSAGHATRLPDPLAGPVVSLRSAQVAFADACDPMRFEANLQPIPAQQHEAQVYGDLMPRSLPRIGVPDRVIVCCVVNFGVEPLGVATTLMTSDCMAACPLR